MAEKGPILRRGTITNNTTTIGTFASSTGLPPESYTTSFINESVGIFDGHDSTSASTGIKTPPFSYAGGAAVAIGYLSPAIVPSVSGNANTYMPSETITNGVAGTTLPTPATATVYYKMVGYYTTGAVYESFVTTGSPASASTTNPNTGHALINTFVALSWTASS